MGLFHDLWLAKALPLTPHTPCKPFCIITAHVATLHFARI
jgi:hypothetical protein